jgi:4-hydroxy-4-methyl-2-oxoglutarate aldolase
MAGRYTGDMGEQTNFQSVPARLEALSPDLASMLTSAIMSDSLDALGVRGQVMSAGIGPLVAGGRVLGRASTIQFVPTEADAEDPYGPAMAFIDGLKSGSVAVIATGADARTGYWGELFSAAAKGHGAVGAVCDGPVRDVAKIRAVGFDVFAPGSRPVDFRARMRVVSAGEPVRCGGALVTPGDLVLGDDDGVVVVPAGIEAEALALAVGRATAERTVLEELLRGASLREVWDRWHVL